MDLLISKLSVETETCLKLALQRIKNSYLASKFAKITRRKHFTSQYLNKKVNKKVNINDQ